MPGPKPSVVKLTEEESRGLKKLVRQHSTRQQIALRARIVLAATEEKNNTEIALEDGGGIDGWICSQFRWAN